jgi:hypothetical protein
MYQFHTDDQHGAKDIVFFYCPGCLSGCQDIPLRLYTRPDGTGYQSTEGGQVALFIGSLSLCLFAPKNGHPSEGWWDACISVLWIRNDFLSRPYFSVGFGSYINFTFVLPSFKCVRLHNLTSYQLFREIIFFIKRNLYF